MKIADLSRSGLWLAVWWLLPALLTLGVPGYWAIALLVFILLGVFLAEPARPGAIFLWMPLATGSALVCGGALLIVLSVLFAVFNSPPNSAGPWAIGLLLMAGGPTLGVAVLLAAPILISTTIYRPKGEWQSLGVVALVNTILLFAVCKHVAAHGQGAAYFATMPKLVKIAHNPPMTAEEKATTRWLDAFREAGLSTECQMPIDFYGIFLDQDGKPVEGVKVRYTTNPPKAGMTVNEGVCYSGADGKFEIRGQHGLSLFFLLGKEGYTQIGDIQSTDYDFINYEKPNFYVADPLHPAVIRLTQRPAIEPLTIWRGHVPFLKAEEKFYIDPETGKTSAQTLPGAIWISISPELEDSSPGKRGTVSLGIDGGGIAPPTPSSNDYAPESGYTETWERDNIDGEFLTLAVCFKTTSGKYGRLWIRGQSVGHGLEQPRPIDYEIFLNSNGSRVLRYNGF